MSESCETWQPLDFKVDGFLKNHDSVWNFRSLGKGYNYNVYTKHRSS